MYKRWLYGRRGYTTSELLQINSYNRVVGEGLSEDFYDLLALWCLGNDLQDPRLRDMVVSEIWKRFREAKNNRQLIFLSCLKPYPVHDIYNNTKRDSPMRALLVDTTVKFTKPGHLPQLNQYSIAFVQSVTGRAFQELLRLRSHDFVPPTKRKSVTLALNMDGAVSAPKTVRPGYNAGNGDVLQDCEYHEHSGKDWPCCRLKPWG
jgi:hypothetical protein